MELDRDYLFAIFLGKQLYCGLTLLNSLWLKDGEDEDLESLLVEDRNLKRVAKVVNHAAQYSLYFSMLVPLLLVEVACLQTTFAHV